VEPEAVLERDEIEQALLGLADDVGPVPGAEQFVRARERLAPRGRMPARAVEGNAEVQKLGWCRGVQDCLPSVVTRRLTGEQSHSMSIGFIE